MSENGCLYHSAVMATLKVKLLTHTFAACIALVEAPNEFYLQSVAQPESTVIQSPPQGEHIPREAECHSPP